MQKALVGSLSLRSLYCSSDFEIKCKFEYRKTERTILLKSLKNVGRYKSENNFVELSN